MTTIYIKCYCPNSDGDLVLMILEIINDVPKEPYIHPLNEDLYGNININKKVIGLFDYTELNQQPLRFSLIDNIFTYENLKNNFVNIIKNIHITPYDNYAEITGNILCKIDIPVIKTLVKHIYDKGILDLLSNDNDNIIKNLIDHNHTYFSQFIKILIIKNVGLASLIFFIEKYYTEIPTETACYDIGYLFKLVDEKDTTFFDHLINLLNKLLEYSKSISFTYLPKNKKQFKFIIDFITKICNAHKLADKNFLQFNEVTESNLGINSTNILYYIPILEYNDYKIDYTTNTKLLNDIIQNYNNEYGPEIKNKIVKLMKNIYKSYEFLKYLEKNEFLGPVVKWMVVQVELFDEDVLTIENIVKFKNNPELRLILINLRNNMIDYDPNNKC